MLQQLDAEWRSGASELEPGRPYALSWSRGNVVPREFAMAVAGNDSTLDVRVAAGGR